MYMYNLTTLLIQLKLTQYYKSTILQYKIKIKLKKHISILTPKTCEHVLYCKESLWRCN